MIPEEEAEPVDSHVAALRLRRQRQFLNTARIATRNANMLSQIPIILACADMGLYKMYERADS